jgi:hypothetical protein
MVSRGRGHCADSVCIRLAYFSCAVISETYSRSGAALNDADTYIFKEHGPKYGEFKITARASKKLRENNNCKAVK